MLLRIWIFEEFLKVIASKLGTRAAFDLGRDAQLKSFRKVLIQKGIITEEEMRQIEKAEFEQMAEMIQKMPPLPPQ